MLYGIWRNDADQNRGDWLRPVDDSTAIIAYQSKRAAWSRAAGEYGYPTYTAARRDGWCEVRPLPATMKPRTEERSAAGGDREE